MRTPDHASARRHPAPSLEGCCERGIRTVGVYLQPPGTGEATAFEACVAAAQPGDLPTFLAYGLQQSGDRAANFGSLLMFDPVAQLVEQRTFNP